MTVFNRDFTLAFIKEVGEDDILISVQERDIVVNLTEENKESVLQAVEEGIYIIPYSLETNELLMNVDDEILREIFPESELEELIGLADEIPEEHQ